MFKKKSAPKNAPPAKAASAPPPAAPARAPAKGGKKGGGSPLGLLLIPLLLVGIGAIGYVAYTRFFKSAAPAPEAQVSAPSLADPSLAALPEDQAVDDAAQAAKKANKAAKAKAAAENAPAETETNVLAAAPMQNVAPDCAGRPGFVKKLGLGDDAQFSTNEPGTRGLFLTASSVEGGGAPTQYQHQSWNRAGYLDAFVMDRAGNLYVAPSPRTGPGVPEPKNQDRIYKLDSASGVLEPFVTLPAAAPPSPENPYGVMGLAYDCDTNALYATTVTGSTPGNPVGRIYRIDAATGEIGGQLDNVDGYGVAVHSTGSGKELYFGSAQKAEILAVGLDANGNFEGEPRPVGALADPQRARAIVFDDAGEMIVQAVEFNFHSTDIPSGSEIHFTYDAAANTWNEIQ